ncbi:SPOR domain-containing protein [Novosphingobium aerophilum]|uniref:SPOR domain-containing protein n=1 Tax=Novosphingobium aerophilum TaxID=2839843 RepID=UPI001FD021E8|nr:SPOR domain-containing protein [Novosphingobium aerophilum]
MNDNNSEGRMDDDMDFPGNEVLSGAAPQPALALDDDERLPWLESADDDDDVGAVDTGRIVRFAAFAVALLALIVGGIWYLNHRGTGEAQVAEGGVIAAPAEPYKSEPADKGGKTFAGTGDSAFAVSEGKNPAAKLAGTETPVAAASPSIAVPPPAPDAKPAGAVPPPAAATSGGVGVQVGAYSSQATAEAGWARLSSSHDVLKGVKHRIVEGSADIGTVYRLQAVTADLASANALCSSLKAAGVACQVKR